MNSATIIAQLGLEPHLEGGYFRRSYTAPHSINGRPAMSSIYYLLTADSPIGHLHRNRSDILHFWQGGSSLRYTLISPNGELKQKVMGPNIGAGEQLQILVPGGYWKASELCAGDHGLISEAVCPGFDFADHQLASAAQIQRDHPQHWQGLTHLISPSRNNNS
ncbi:cupin domain-containing protein [Zhongshania sp.]|uniref:cupin domain-containing protein n=1 Tax=Zhongshania sp. TaxID=1971902 RepID=UPI003563CA04